MEGKCFRILSESKRFGRRDLTIIDYGEFDVEPTIYDLCF